MVFQNGVDEQLVGAFDPRLFRLEAPFGLLLRNCDTTVEHFFRRIRHANRVLQQRVIEWLIEFHNKRLPCPGTRQLKSPVLWVGLPRVGLGDMKFLAMIAGERCPLRIPPVVDNEQRVGVALCKGSADFFVWFQVLLDAAGVEQQREPLPRFIPQLLRQFEERGSRRDAGFASSKRMCR